METLNTKELDLLIEALQAWVNNQRIGHLQSEAMVRFVKSSGLPQEAMDEISRSSEVAIRESLAEIKRREEVSILLQAKLIGMKHEIQTKEMLNNSNKEKS